MTMITTNTIEPPEAMTSLIIRPLAADEEAALFAFAGARNVPGAQLCLHLTDRPEEVAADLGGLDAPLVERCLVATSPGAPSVWRGAIAYDIGGEGDGRCWLLGPWVEPGDDRAVAEALIAAVLARLPPGVRRVDNYLDDAFAAGRACHERLGFVAGATVHILRAAADPPRSPVPTPPGVRIDAHRPVWRDALCALHAEAFPDTHTSIDDIAARSPDRDRLLVAHTAGDPLGYVHLHRPPELPEGTVQYIAVAPAARGRGIGRALLAAGLDWLLGEVGVAEVFLTVHADNRRALGVYHAAGFAPYRSGTVLTQRR